MECFRFITYTSSVYPFVCFLSNVLFIMRKTNSWWSKLSDILNFLNELCEKRSLFKMWFGPKLLIFLNDNKDVRAILNSNKCLGKDEFYFDVIKQATRDGLLTSAVPIWKKHRKIISPAFSSTVLQGFVKTFNTNIDKLIASLLCNCQKKNYNLHLAVADCTTNNILESVMDIKAEDSAVNMEFSKRLYRVKHLVAERFYKVWMHINWIYQLTSLAKEMRENSNFMHNVSANVITTKRTSYREKCNGTKQCLNTESKSIIRTKSFIDFLIEDTDFTDQELLNEVNTLLIAGTDTIITTAGFTLTSLGIHTEIQDKVYQEIMEVLGGRKIGNDNLQKLLYTRRVISEVLRIFPIVPLITRSITEETELESYTLPAGSSVIMNISQLHRNSEIWPEPAKFDPDRFLPEEISQRPPCSYIPFSYGVRNCIGSKYAMMFLTILVAEIVRNFTVSTEYKKIEDVKLSFSVTIEPTEGYKLSLVPREKDTPGTTIHSSQ